MSGGTLAAIIVAGSLLFVGLLLFVTLSAYRGAVKRANALVESEGIVLDSGRGWLKFRLHGFRAPGIYMGSAYRSGPGRLVLTPKRLVAIPVPRRMGSIANIALHDLARFQVGPGDGGLLLRTSDPPNAQGNAEVVVKVPNVETWVKALTDAGARPLGS
jgi:hypothetical protein